MNFNIGDIVKSNSDTWPDMEGIYEVITINENKSVPYIISNGRDEFFANDERLILVCHYKDRKDI